MVFFTKSVSKATNEPTHEILALFVLRKLILQTHMRSHPVGLDLWFWSDPSSTSILYVSEQRRLWQDCVDAQARLSLTDHLCDKDHNFVGLLKWDVAQQNQQNDLCAQWRLRSTWASAQSDQSLCCPHEETLGPWLSLESSAKIDQTGEMPRLF